MNAPHLDDGALSAALDGAPSSQAEQAHLSGCPTCQARLEQIAAVAEAVGVPVPRRPVDEVNAAIQHALAPPGSRASAPLGAMQTRRRPTSRRSRRWFEAAGAIAAAAVLIGGVAALLGRGGASNPASKASSGAAVSESASTVVSGQAAVGVGDLGEQSDPTQLARLVTIRLAAVSPSPSNAGAAQPSTDTETSCVGPARGAAGLPADHGVPRLVASLHWRGQPAVVYVFDRSGPAAGRAGVVIRTTDCAFLTALPL
jgi:predicted anti-sigma-YlaC factor YlaD